HRPDGYRCLEVARRTGTVADVRAQHAANVEKAREMLLGDVRRHRSPRLVEETADDAGAVALLVRHQALRDAKRAIEVLRERVEIALRARIGRAAALKRSRKEHGVVA